MDLFPLPSVDDSSWAVKENTIMLSKVIQKWAGCLEFMPLLLSLVSSITTPDDLATQIGHAVIDAIFIPCKLQIVQHVVPFTSSPHRRYGRAAVDGPVSLCREANGQPRPAFLINDTWGTWFVSTSPVSYLHSLISQLSVLWLYSS